MNKEFRRRVKVQESLPHADGAVALLHALWAEDFITLRRLDGYESLAHVLVRRRASGFSSSKAARMFQPVTAGCAFSTNFGKLAIMVRRSNPILCMGAAPRRYVKGS